MSHAASIEKKLSHEGDLEKKETLNALETRWKYAIFPAMIAFIILAAFGFYLIYGMLQRMEDLSHNVYRMTEVIQTSMPSMQNDMSQMSSNIQQINTTIQQNFPSLAQDVSSMSHDMKDMSHSTLSMAGTTYNLSRNVWELNKNVSQPLSLINHMLPWNKSQRIPPPRYSQAIVYPQYPPLKASTLPPQARLK